MQKKLTRQFLDRQTILNFDSDNKNKRTMKKLLLISTAVLVLTVANKQTMAQTYPTFGNEIPVTINGLTFDAMEPSISADGNYLFFNSLNDNITTSLFYATKVEIPRKQTHPFRFNLTP